MGRPEAERVPSDDCVVVVRGGEYRPHEGEWVERVPGYKVEDMRLGRAMAELGVRLAALDDEAALERLTLTDDSYQDAIAMLSRRVLAWNWTDDAGDALPAPKGNAAVFERLTPSEVMYLVAVVRGESPGEAKNGSRPSLITSSATRPQTSQA
jgi:hypothetical protein